MRDSAEAAVLVIGAGPSGLFAAIELARHGVHARIVEREPHPHPPEAVAALARARSMLDVSYQGSPLTGERIAPGTPPQPSPASGDRYPGRAWVAGTRHQALVFGTASDADVAGLVSRWHGIVDVSRGTGDPRRVGLATDGVVLIRPEGYLGFRAAPADRAAVSALDSHLSSYLVPASG